MKLLSYCCGSFVTSDSCVAVLEFRSRAGNESRHGASPLRALTVRPVAPHLPRDPPEATAHRRHHARAATKAQRNTQRPRRSRPLGTPRWMAFGLARDAGESRPPIANAFAGYEGKTDLPSCFPTIASRLVKPTRLRTLNSILYAQCAGGMASHASQGDNSRLFGIALSTHDLFLFKPRGRKHE